MALQLFISRAKTDISPSSLTTPDWAACSMKVFMVWAACSGTSRPIPTPRSTVRSIPRAHIHRVRRKPPVRKSFSREPCSFSHFISPASPVRRAAATGTRHGPGSGRSPPRRRGSRPGPPPRCAPAT